MTLIDEKGRFLGLVNILDFLVIILFLSFAPMFYYAYDLIFIYDPKIDKIHYKIEEGLVSFTIKGKHFDSKTTVTVFPKPGYKKSYKREIGHITYTDRNTIKGKFKSSEMETIYDVVVENSKNRIAVLKEGIKIDTQRNVFNLKIKIREINQDIGRLIMPGDNILNLNDVVIGRVKSIISNEPRTDILLRDGKYFELIDSEIRNITMLLELYAFRSDGRFYYMDREVGVGNSIDLKTDKYTINGLVVGIKKIK
ncbi:MAG: DUF4330 family protein [Nitrospirota bacterium]